ncbi:hypothetical protein [Cellulosimicrobium sp. NPDC057127]|uniref:hypothetical protein n=1 Tax=Cellulosimicrobium sp. NPDC057127 TaxID=3346026 RepID=UPI003631CE0C
MSAATLGAVLLVATGCGSSVPAGPEACDTPKLMWSEDAASPGEVVTLLGSSMMTGCSGAASDGAEPQPLRITAAELFVDREAMPAPTVAEGITANDVGVLEMQLAVPDGVPAGSALTVELTESEGAVIRSDELVIERAGT